jgi:hypothetical protein
MDHSTCLIGKRITSGLIMALLSLAVAVSASAELPLIAAPSFRVETDIYEGDATTPQTRHLILFDAGVVYDLPVDLGPTMTVFDVPRGRVVLLHKTSRVKSSITTDTLIQMTAQLRAAAAAQGAAEKLGIDAKIVPATDPYSYTVAFGDSRYEATTQPVNNTKIAAEFASFTAWASRLNIARHVGSPPFARIALAEQMAAEERLPRQVKLQVKLGVRGGFKTRTYRSEHLVVERLSDLDRKKISDVGGMMATFTEVDFSEFPSD